MPFVFTNFDENLPVMKKLILPFIILSTAILYSCNNGWHQENKDAFYEACMDDANTWINDPDKARTYCECVIIKVMEKYPNVDDALADIDALARDPDIQACRVPILK